MSRHHTNPAETCDTEEHVAPESAPLTSTAVTVPFHGEVPDFMLADAGRARPFAHRGQRSGRPMVSAGIYWFIYLAVIHQCKSQVIVPDVLLRQTVWGTDPPANWRNEILRMMRDQRRLGQVIKEVRIAEDQTEAYECPSRCEMHGSPVRHRHLLVEVECPQDEPDSEGGISGVNGQFLGVLEAFGVEGSSRPRSYMWNPRPVGRDEPKGEEEKRLWEENKRWEARIRKLRKSGAYFAAYLPTLLFGRSPRVPLTFGQVQQHKAITRELTRRRGKGGSREDNAEVITVNARTAPEVAFTGLPPGRYVQFSGNGTGRRARFRGRGYSLFTWMRRSMHLPDVWDEDTPEEQHGWSEAAFKQGAGLFLRDLAAVCRFFGLTAAAWHPKRRQWLGLDELTRLVLSRKGREWLAGCRLRIYAPEDYLTRWRRAYADAMGFSVIPGGLQGGGAPRPDTPTTVASAAASREAFLAYLEHEGINRSSLASELGVSKALVSQHLSGGRGWTPAWKSRLERWLSGRQHGSPGSTSGRDPSPAVAKPPIPPIKLGGVSSPHLEGFLREPADSVSLALSPIAAESSHRTGLASVYAA